MFGSKGNIKVEDLDQLLKLAGVGDKGFKGLVEQAAVKVQSMRTEVATLTTDATKIQHDAEKVFAEETKAAREKMQKATAGVDGMLTKADTTAKAAKEAGKLLAKYERI